MFQLGTFIQNTLSQILHFAVVSSEFGDIYLHFVYYFLLQMAVVLESKETREMMNERFDKGFVGLYKSVYFTSLEPEPEYLK